MNVLFTQEKQIMIHTQIALVEIHTAVRCATRTTLAAIFSQACRTMDSCVGGTNFPAVWGGLISRVLAALPTSAPPFRRDFLNCISSFFHLNISNCCTFEIQSGNNEKHLFRAPNTAPAKKTHKLRRRSTAWKNR